jgi:hypothetical protein
MQPPGLARLVAVVEAGEDLVGDGDLRGAEPPGHGGDGADLGPELEPPGAFLRSCWS